MNKTHMHSRLLPVAIATWPICLKQTAGVSDWLGTAIRGALTLPLRKKMCLLGVDGLGPTQHPNDPRPDWRYCAGCNQMNACQFGRVFEPDLRQLNREHHKGNHQGLRLLTFASVKPTIDSPSIEQTVRVAAVGEHAIGMFDDIDFLLRLLGRSGIGPDHVPFSTGKKRIDFLELDVSEFSLPLKTKCRSVTDIELTTQSPLLAQKSWLRSPPSFSSLAMASIRTVSRAIREVGSQSLAGIDFKLLKQYTELVAEVDAAWSKNDYRRSSNRQGTKWRMNGWIGSAHYKAVPDLLIPWLEWGGRLGIGDSRNCGAGIWQIQIVPTAKS